MIKTILFTLFLILAITRMYGQTIETKKVSYANTLIDVPKDYDSKDAYSIESNLFSAQWLYLSKEMVEKGVQKQMIKQFEKQIKFSESTEIDFISNNSMFSGKKYLLKGDSNLKYKILAFGTIDGQPLILNMSFKENPTLDQEFDEVVKQFIQFKKQPKTAP
jgi:hypothetical protein